ncbi:uncharacterized protein MYCFIDRAFT_173750 [Pseudocercospora fijiensis CIRAD86]|uniref:Uncharacterized protein n=1 Tax=Pseudocercospora fijiensis (strain CIRAD86) TaxID=383855 RepID=M2Z4W8_PSEFD|nr:uncharacterized protein MYCFIDRAFT_173750 [Pseudocercospora fijiensis CIRAD86]EME84845.1 hypothetical protein MYCFIDRAFT_173750 [Pseudocercospora fijiensis CIRAD86]
MLRCAASENRKRQSLCRGSVEASQVIDQYEWVGPRYTLENPAYIQGFDELGPESPDCGRKLANVAVGGRTVQGQSAISSSRVNDYYP